MPDERTHIDQVAHNTAFLNSINWSAYGDWATTTVFYIALHCVDAYLANKGIIEVDAHKNREDYAKTFNELKRILSAYRRIKDASIRARYYGDKHSKEEIDSLVKSQLSHIKLHIGKMLGVTL
jgi:hypothetical protein